MSSLRSLYVLVWNVIYTHTYIYIVINFQTLLKIIHICICVINRVSMRKNLRRNCGAKAQKLLPFAWIFCAFLRIFASNLRRKICDAKIAKIICGGIAAQNLRVCAANFIAIAKSMCSCNFFDGYWNYDYIDLIIIIQIWL